MFWKLGPSVTRLILRDRLLKETGRLSNSPIFVVGIFSGADKLGEGFGSSLRMAEYRVWENNFSLDIFNIFFSGCGRFPSPVVSHTTPVGNDKSTHNNVPLGRIYL